MSKMISQFSSGQRYTSSVIPHILCSSSEEYAYDTTIATAALTKASDSNMEIMEGSYTDDTVVTKVTLSRTESSNMIERHFYSETVIKTNMNDTEMQITSTKNYNCTLFGVTQITHGVTADQQPSTVPTINEDTNAEQNGIIIEFTASVLVLIGVCVGEMFFGVTNIYIQTLKQMQKVK